MEYKFRKIIYKNGKEEVVIDFPEGEDYECLWYFINLELDQFENWIKEYFQTVLSGQKEELIRFGNICRFIITPKRTTIINMLADEAEKTLDRIEVDTQELVRLSYWWCDCVRQWKKDRTLPGEYGVWYHDEPWNAVLQEDGVCPA